MGPFVLLHVALVGVFACAGVYSVWNWWLARERTLLLFAVQCFLSAGISASVVKIVTAHTTEAALSAVNTRTITGLFAMATTAALVARITGVAARKYVTFVILFAVVASIVRAAVGPPRLSSFTIGQYVLPWGETITLPAWTPAPWWFTVAYAVVISVNVFGIIGALRLAQTDRAGGLLVGVAATTGLVTSAASLLTDVRAVPIPYAGTLAFACWVGLAGLQLSRENLQIRRLRSSAERRLRDSEQRFRALVEGLDIGVVLQDAEDRILVSNPAAARMLGLTEEQLRGGSSRDPEWKLVREDGSTLPFEEVPSVVAARTHQVVRNQIVGTSNRQTGRRMWLQVSATPRMSAEGTLRNVFVTLVDVTDRKRAEKADRASSRRLALAISATSDVVWDWNLRTGETYFSPHLLKMLGYPEASMPTTMETWRSLVHPDDLGPTIKYVNSMVASRTPTGYEIEYRIRHADGSWRWVVSRGNVVEWDSDGNPVLLAGTTTEITQRKDAEARRREIETRAAQAQRMESMGRLAGGIAHDFNNLLTIINGYTELLLNAPSFDDATREMLEDIRNAGERAAALTGQLLTFSRHQIVNPTVLDVNVVIGGTSRMLRRLIGEQIDLRVTLASEPLWVCIDSTQLDQIVMNLAVNARDAMPHGGSLTIETTKVELDSEGAAAIGANARPGRYAMLSVADTGSGIPAELRELVFEPFFTTKERGKGTGLGLTTVHGIVSQCEGFLSMTSAPSTGTTFRIYLPMVAEPEREAPGAAPSTPAMHHRATVLVAEDERAVRGVVQTMLQRAGFDVLEAVSGEDALRVAEHHAGQIDLLLTDIIMSGINGRQLAEQLTARRPGLAVLYMSGYTDDPRVQEIVLHANGTYVQKPFDADTLTRKIRQALEAPPA